MSLTNENFMRIAVAGSVLALGCLVVTVLHLDPPCSEETSYELTSPGGRYAAASMVRNCGATTSYVTHVNLRSSKSQFKPGFLDGTIKEGEVTTVGNYDGKVLFCWRSSQQLNIEYPTPESERSAKHSWRDITVTYGQGCP
jgi:hypothetical protein